MPYVKEICRAGKTKNYNFYYTYKYDKKEGGRQKKKNKTPEAQKKVNIRMAEKKLTWILNENYSGEDLYITFSYEVDKRPTKEELKKHMEKLSRDLRRLYKKNNRVLKYVLVPEVGKKGAVHLHMVVPGIESRKLKSVWEYGWITIKPMDDSGEYSKLANYFMKYSEKTMRTDKALMKKRYSRSKNLKMPEPTKKPVLSRNAYNTEIRVPEGWYLKKESVKVGFHEITGHMFFSYILVQTKRKRMEEEKGIFEWEYKIQKGAEEIEEWQNVGTIKIKEVRR